MAGECEEKDDVEEFLNRSSAIMDDYEKGLDIHKDVRLLHLPSACTPGICMIYDELQNLINNYHQENSIDTRLASRSDNLISTFPCHSCQCSHLPLQRTNSGLQAKDFVYLIICIIFAIFVYSILYSPSSHPHRPIY